MKKILLLNLLVATTFVVFAGDSIPNGKKVNSMVLKFSMGVNISYPNKDYNAVNLGINPGVNFMLENKKETIIILDLDLILLQTLTSNQLLKILRVAYLIILNMPTVRFLLKRSCSG